MKTDLDKVIQGMAEDILNIMREIMDDNDLAYSNLKKNMYTEAKIDGDNAVLKLITAHYIYWVDQGRKPTNIPPLSKWNNPVGDITSWYQRKFGATPNNSTVWAIIQKIHKYGYEGKFFLEDFWRQAEQATYDNLDKLFEVIIKDLTEWFNKK